ncbi:2-oxoglutarate (2OG) and Fe(II)-dependent oxygenase superfamily protein [Wolffia australiana]
MGEAMSVQSFAEAGLERVPEKYVQPERSRPSIGGDGRRIPVVDLFFFDPARSGEVREALKRACREWGAFQVVNHGVPVDVIDRVVAAGEAFFGRTAAERRRFSCDPNSVASEGYGSRLLSADDAVLDWRDYFNHHTLPLARRNPSRWPDLAGYRAAVAAYADAAAALARKLLGILSECVGLAPSFLESAIGRLHQNVTVSYYPPCPQPELALGLQPHSDMGALTLLLQDDVPGLQVLRDGNWVLVAPLAGAIVVLLADQTEIITNGEYRSGVHRAVVNADRPRISVAAFHDPAKSAEISPAAPLLSGGSPPRYRPVRYGDYVSSWYGQGPDGRRLLDALLL